MSSSLRDVRLLSIPSGKQVTSSLSPSLRSSRLWSLWIELSNSQLHFPPTHSTLRAGRKGRPNKLGHSIIVSCERRVNMFSPPSLDKLINFGILFNNRSSKAIKHPAIH